MPRLIGVKSPTGEQQSYLPPSLSSAFPQMNIKCSSYPKTDMDCCSFGAPCGVGEGDCDYDTDCHNGLRCGKDNCYYDFPSHDIRTNWDILADCCYGKSIENKSVIYARVYHFLPNYYYVKYYEFCSSRCDKATSQKSSITNNNLNKM